MRRPDTCPLASGGILCPRWIGVGGSKRLAEVARVLDMSLSDRSYYGTVIVNQSVTLRIGIASEE
jgi:hypothetical protein